MLPDLPPAGVDPQAPATGLSGAKVIDHDYAWGDPANYVFAKTGLQRNLFRIPLH